MAKLTKVYQNIFGSTAGTDQIAQFGSKYAGTPTFTTNPTTVQALSNFLTGWFAAAIGTPSGNSPAIEDMNALFYLITYQLAYYSQAGIPEWDASTIYYTGSLAQVAGVIYVSLTDTNSGNLVTDTTKWTVVGGAILSAAGDIIYGGTNGAQTRLAGNTSTIRQFLAQTGTGSASAAPVWVTPTAPTYQTFTSGSGTYTTPAGVLYLKIRMVGGGGGGGGSSNGSGGGTGGTGGNTSFGSSLSANGGLGGVSGAAGGVGGIVVTGAGPIIINALQGGGGGGGGNTNTGIGVPGGNGGSSPFGGAGGGGGLGQTGISAIANSGSGGSGASAVGATIVIGGAGGGSGGYIEAQINSPISTYSYAIGVSGAVGSAGSAGHTGGLGGSGYLIVEEYYQ